MHCHQHLDENLCATLQGTLQIMYYLLQKASSSSPSISMDQCFIKAYYAARQILGPVSMEQKAAVFYPSRALKPLEACTTVSQY